MGAAELYYLEGVLQANSIQEIATAIEKQIRDTYTHKFCTDTIKVLFNGEFYSLFADVTHYDDDFHITVFEDNDLNDNLCADIEDILIREFDPTYCENTRHILEEQTF